MSPPLGNSDCFNCWRSFTFRNVDCAQESAWRMASARARLAQRWASIVILAGLVPFYSPRRSGELAGWSSCDRKRGFRCCRMWSHSWSVSRFLGARYCESAAAYRRRHQDLALGLNASLKSSPLNSAIQFSASADCEPLSHGCTGATGGGYRSRWPLCISAPTASGPVLSRVEGWSPAWTAASTTSTATCSAPPWPSATPPVERLAASNTTPMARSSPAPCPRTSRTGSLPERGLMVQ